MFYPRIQSKAKPQKRRRNQRFTWNNTLPFFPGRQILGVFSTGPGHMTYSLVERFFIWGKRLSSHPTQLVRFWVNLQAAGVVTRKGLNMRMGKGKGKRGRSYAKIQAYTWLLALTHLRQGLLNSLFRYARARCSFPVGITPRGLEQASLLGWTDNSSWFVPSILTRHYVRQQIPIARENVKFIRQRLLVRFYARLFLWHGLTPAAVVSRPYTYRARRRQLRKLRRRRVSALYWPQRLGFLQQLLGWRRYTRRWLLARWVAPSFRWSTLHRRWYHSTRLMRLQYSPEHPGLSLSILERAYPWATYFCGHLLRLLLTNLPQYANCIIPAFTQPRQMRRQLRLQLVLVLWSRLMSRRMLPDVKPQKRKTGRPGRLLNYKKCVPPFAAFLKENKVLQFIQEKSNLK